MGTKDVAASSAPEFKYEVPIGDGESYELITHFGDGRVGIVYSQHLHNRIPYRLGIVKIRDGSMLWERMNYDTWGIGVPLCDERAIYMPMNDMHQNMAAYDKETGEELWTRYIGNGTYNFQVPPMQTALHVVAANVNSGGLTVIDKGNGKIAGKVKMPHKLSEHRPMLCPWRDKFVAVAFDRKNDQWTIDLYDSAAEGLFVGTLFRYPEKKGDVGKFRVQKIVGDSMYFFTKEGLFYKLDLLSGKVLEKHSLPDASHSKYGWDYTGKYIHQYNGQLCAIGSFHTVEDDKVNDFALRYDLESGVFSAIPIAERTPYYLQFYKNSAYSLTKEGLERWDVLGDGSRTEIALEHWEADPIDYDTYEESGESGERWLIAEDRLLAVLEAKEGEDRGRLLCWEL